MKKQRTELQRQNRKLYADDMYDLLKELLDVGSFHISAIEADHPSVDFEEYEEKVIKIIKEIEA